ncbi:MAG: extracellular solute-binding protein [Elusimicrobiales bacterium]|nr:extracellular solute-binding protein [Elusimicrobiales bacterium]
MKVWLLSDYDNRKHQAFRGLIYRYSLKHSSDISVDVKSRSNLWRSLFAHLRDSVNNPLPDVMELPLNWTRRFSSLGLLADLKPYIKSLSENAYPASIMEELCRHGDSEIYSVPWWQKAPALHYRKEALEEFCDNPREEFSSWKGFRRVLDKISASAKFHNHSLLSVPGSSGAAGLGEVLPRIWARKGGLYSDDFTRATFTRDETSSGIQDWLDLAIDGYIRLFSPDRFLNGYIPGPNYIFMLSSRRPVYLGGQMSVLPYPGCAKGGSLLLVNNLAVSSSSLCKKEALSLVEWLTDGLNAGTFADYFGVFPCLSSAFESRLAKEPEAFRRIFSSPELLPNFSFYPSAELLLQRLLWRISLKISSGQFRQEDLRRELIIAQAEADYLLTLD